MIETVNLSKGFKNYKKPPGFVASFKSLFHREYEYNQAVDSFNVDIQPGEIVGLLGPNGAGKTTLMKMFTGIIVPTKGDLKVLGYVPSQRKRLFRKQIALVMGQKSQLWWDIPAMDSFQLLQKYYEIEENDFNVEEGLKSAMTELYGVIEEDKRYLNFFLSDGEKIWTFRKGNTLFYKYDEQAKLTFASSTVPDDKAGDWEEFPEDTIAVFDPKT